MSPLREKRRIEIIQAALEVFGEHGYFLGKMEDIAKVAGIGKATVYEYFNSKNQLFQQMLIYFVEDYIQGAYDATFKEITVRSKLISLSDYNIIFVRSQAKTLEQIFARSENISNEIRPVILQMKQTVYNFIFEIVAKGIETGELNPDLDKEIATLIIMGAINSTSTKGILSQEESARTLDSSTIVDMLLSGLRKN